LWWQGWIVVIFERFPERALQLCDREHLHYNTLNVIFSDLTKSVTEANCRGTFRTNWRQENKSSSEYWSNRVRTDWVNLLNTWLENTTFDISETFYKKKKTFWSKGTMRIIFVRTPEPAQRSNHVSRVKLSHQTSVRLEDTELSRTCTRGLTKRGVCVVHLTSRTNSSQASEKNVRLS
jgi:hypothetical protein